VKIKLMEQVTGPNGEKFSDEAELRHAPPDSWVVSEDGTTAKMLRSPEWAHKYIVLSHVFIPPATKVERIKADKDNGYMCADGRCLSVWPTYATFRGAVYIHPMSKSEQVFSFTNPVFIRPEHGFMAEPFPWSFTRDEWHTAMLWPSFVEVER